MKTTSEPTSFRARVSRGTCAVVELSGELDLVGAGLLESALRDLDLSPVRDVVLDLRRLSFIDAAGLNAVLDLYAECLSADAILTIIPGPPSVHRVFELTRLDQLLTFCPL